MSSTNIVESTYFHPTAIIDNDCLVGLGTKIWHYSHLMSTAKVGQNCMIGDYCFIAGTVGDNCRIQNNVNLFEGVTLENDVFIGPGVTFTNDKYPPYGEREETLIKQGATIGANATILCGIVIGKGALIGAGSVVTRDVPDYTTVVGNPARVIGE